MGNSSSKKEDKDAETREETPCGKIVEMEAKEGKELILERLQCMKREVDAYDCSDNMRKIIGVPRGQMLDDINKLIHSNLKIWSQTDWQLYNTVKDRYTQLLRDKVRRLENNEECLKYKF